MMEYQVLGETLESTMVSINSRDVKSLVCSSCTRPLKAEAIYCDICKKELNKINKEIIKKYNNLVNKIVNEGYRVQSGDYLVNVKYGRLRTCKICKININYRSSSAMFCKSCSKLTNTLRTKGGSTIRNKKKELELEYLREFT